MKLALVVQRYGAEVGGGAERHARDFAIRLSDRHDVTVLTSCALDYITWRNHFPPGEERDGRVRVIRFRTARERDPERFAALGSRVLVTPGTLEDEEEWFRENGPYMPDLLQYLRDRQAEHDGFLFFAYRYFHSYFGLPLVASKAILVPTAEEDPAIRLRALRSFLRLPRGYVHNTPEERELLRQAAGGELPPGEVVGCGIDAPREEPRRDLLERLSVRPPYVLYLGRVDRNKGCDHLMRYFRSFHESADRGVTLCLSGKAVMEIPPHPFIRHTGYVSDEELAALLGNAVALVNHSPYESLSLVVLESWNHRRPVLVTGRCQVMKEQVRRANGGLYYDGYREFAACLAFLLDHPEEASQLGLQGRAYVDREYRWPTVMERLERVLERCLARTGATAPR